MNRSRTSRRGVSLVEMLVVMSLGAVVLGGVVTGARSFLQANRRVLSQDEPERLRHQLFTRLRADLHRATVAAWDEDQATLRLTMPGQGDITYRQTEGPCVRMEGETKTRFPTPSGEGLRCGFTSQTAPGLIELDLIPVPGRPPARLIALLGRDLFLTIEEQAE